MANDFNGIERDWSEKQKNDQEIEIILICVGSRLARDEGFEKRDDTRLRISHARRDEFSWQSGLEYSTD